MFKVDDCHVLVKYSTVIRTLLITGNGRMVIAAILRFIYWGSGQNYYTRSGPTKIN